ncbi:MAG: TetR/AcrR family transcriptional regulator [Betaproteobacteria bacterium]|nr:TetR/AcrR family transcriptional regulator [Betaproteobacteria bacterium]
MTSTPSSTRDRLIEAAARVFLEEGVETASMDRVRQAAGVSNGSLYHHFPTRAHLAGALYLETLRDFHAALLKPLAADPDAEAGVRGLVRGYLRWVVAHPERARLLHRLRRNGELEGMEGVWAAPNEVAYAALGAWIGRKVAAGGMRRLPFAVWMALVFSPAYALTPQWVAQDAPTVPPAVRAALEDAAWHAVAPA